MIIQERFTINGREFIRTYSDAGCYIVRDGVSYGEANDPAEFGRVYTEGELMPVDESVLSDKAEAYDILMGVNE